MSLEVNKNDASVDTRQMTNNRLEFRRTIAGFLVALTLFSGSALGVTTVYAQETDVPSASQSIDQVSPSTVVEIPEAYQYEVCYLCGKERGEPITVGDLNAIDDMFMNLSIVDGESLEWLNYVGNIEYLTMIIHADDTSVLKNIKKLKNVKNLSILSPFSTSIELKNEDFAFLRNSESIKELSISGYVSMEPGFLESLTGIKKLSLYLQDGNHTYDCSKLGFLDELELYEPYSAAVYITQEDYDELIRNGVKVTFSSDSELESFKKINKKLDEIVESLGVDENSTEQEKLDALLCYVLDTLTYDPEVSEALRTNEEHGQLTRSFYNKGLLYGALEKDTAICGNYAALTNALAERLDLASYYLISEDHAWSLVEVEGEQYYVDSTWLDSGSVYKRETKYEYDESGRVIAQTTTYKPVSAAEAIRDGNKDELEWYMEDPEGYPKSETQAESHIVINLPSFFGINPQEESDKQTETTLPEETTHETESPAPTVVPQEETLPQEGETEPIILDGKDVELRSGNKAWIISGAAAIGVLTALGGAVAVKKHKDKKERERRRRQMQYDAFYDPFGSTSPYGSSYSSYDDPFNSTPTYNDGRKRRR